jgi:outer membrane lipase/esterase
MKTKNSAAATAILGLAFGGAMTSTVSAYAQNSFKAVDNAANEVELPNGADEGTADASGTAVIEEGAATGNVNTVSNSKTIVSACTSGANPSDSQFQQDCSAIVGGSTSDPQGTSAALTALTPDQVDAQNRAAAQQVTVQQAVIKARMGGLRLASGVRGFSPDEAIASNFLYGPATGGGASADAQFGSTGVFFNIKYFDGSQDRNNFTSGYDTDGWTATLGADYRVQNNLILGALVDYSSGNVDYDANKGEMDGESWGIGAYGTYFLKGGGFVEGIVGYNSDEYDMKRNIRYSISDATGNVTNVNQTAKSSPNADVFYASLGGGYNIDRQSYTLTPQLSLNYVNNSVDSYTERMSDPSAPGGGFAVSYGSETYDSMTSRLGFVAAKAVSTASGVFVPQMSIDWIHEFRNDQKDLDARYVNDLSFTPLLITTTEPDRNYFNLGVAVSGQFANGRSAFLSLDVILGYEDVDYYAITGGFRMEF